MAKVWPVKYIDKITNLKEFLFSFDLFIMQDSSESQLEDVHVNADSLGPGLAYIYAIS